MVQFWLQNCAHFPVCTRYQREGQFCLRSTITPKLTEEGTAAKSELRSGITDLWQMRKFPSSALNLVSRIALRYRFNGDFIRVEGSKKEIFCKVLDTVQTAAVRTRKRARRTAESVTTAPVPLLFSSHFSFLWKAPLTRIHSAF